MRQATYKNNSLFTRIYRDFSLYWKAFSDAEKLVFLCVSLVPLVWVVGIYKYSGALLCAGIFYKEYRQYKKVRLGWPSISVAFLLAFATYQCVGLLFFSLATKAVTMSLVVKRTLFWFSSVILLWYVQNRRIKVRLEVVAAAFTILAVEMLVFWFVGQIVLGGNIFDPPRTIFSLASGNASGSYEAGKGLENYLIPYRPEDVVFLGLARWSYFFVIPEVAGIVSAFISLIALDINSRKWSLTLLIIGFFLAAMSGTRSIWLGLPIVIFFRFCILFGRSKGYLLPLLATCFCSFIFLTIPTVTNSITDAYDQATTSVSGYRGDSSDVRGDIYEQTIDAIPDRLLFGHWIPGETVLPGFDLGRVGTHSFILSTLLYRLGIVGTFLFLAFWFSLAFKLLKQLRARTLIGLCTMALYTLLSLPMEFGVLPAVMIVILATIIV